jgi:hypothetical protein
MTSDSNNLELISMNDLMIERTECIYTSCYWFVFSLIFIFLKLFIFKLLFNWFSAKKIYGNYVNIFRYRIKSI